MKIGELAKRSGVSTATIRYYEKMGILPKAKRLASGYREYDETSLKQLQMIKFSQSLGFSLDDISCQEQPGTTFDHQQTLDKLAEKQQQIEQMLQELEHKKRTLALLTEQLKQQWQQNKCMTPELLEQIMRGRSEFYVSLNC